MGFPAAQTLHNIEIITTQAEVQLKTQNLSGQMQLNI
jgi:hypothetical protein